MIRWPACLPTYAYFACELTVFHTASWTKIISEVISEQVAQEWDKFDVFNFILCQK